MKRRHFLTLSTATVLAPSLLVSAHARSAPKRLVVIFLRGAIDSLNVLVPYRDSLYYQARPTIAIPQPNQPGGALPLDDTFGLHPALEPLMSFWSQGQLAFVQSCGSPVATRSHFDAQDYMETGTPGLKSTQDGWMNRLLTQLSGATPAINGLSLGATLPLILQGPTPVTNLQLSSGAAAPSPLDRPPIAAAFDRLYPGHDELSQQYQAGRAARQTLLRHLSADADAANANDANDDVNQGAPGAARFVQEAQRLGRLMVQEPIQLAFMAIGGWDTHVEQGGSTGELAERLQYLGEGLTVLVKALGEVYGDTAIAVVSEFGRTVKENGNGGTDHGYGNALWLLGGGIRGGKVYGQWSGLEQLHEGRDLAVTTDFREPLVGLFKSHLGLNPAQIAQVFPGFRSRGGLEI